MYPLSNRLQNYCMVWCINDISLRKLDWQLWYVILLPLICSTLSRRNTEANVQVEKYDQGHFGACPRVFCHATHVLPCGRADIPGLDTIKLYCPNCGDIYSPPSSKYASVDGESFLPYLLDFDTPLFRPAPFHACAWDSRCPHIAAFHRASRGLDG